MPRRIAILPDVVADVPIEALLRFEAVRLFVDRARAVRTGFALTDQTAWIERERYRMEMARSSRLPWQDGTSVLLRGEEHPLRVDRPRGEFFHTQWMEGGA